MRCLACDAEMRLVQAVADETVLVRGFERHTFLCSDCGDVECRLVFTGQVPLSHSEPSSLHSPPILRSSPADENAAPRIKYVFAQWWVVFRTLTGRVVFRRSNSSVLPVSELQRSALPQASVSAPFAPVPESVPAPKTLPTLLCPAAATVPTPSSTFSYEKDHDLDECEALLRRAIEMVRSPGRSSQIATSVAARTDTGSSPELASCVPAESPPAIRIVVRIRHDPRKAKYVAEDAKSGLSVLRHQDRARLRAMCDRMGWQVVTAQ